MNKKMVGMLLIGWAIALVFPPQRIIGYFTKGAAS